MRLDFADDVKTGTGSRGALRPGTDSRLAGPTPLPSSSKASRTVGVPVEAQKEISTEESGAGNVARTGIDSVAMAQTIAL